VVSRVTRVKWLYRLESNYTWHSGISISEDLVFLDCKDKIRLIIEQDGKITVTRGYSWNGCSPKFFPFDLMLGTPEGAVHRDSGRPKTYHASLIHDALYQFLGNDAPITRHQADAIFKALLQECDFAPGWLYWLAVWALGRFVRRGKEAKRQWKGKRVLVSEWKTSAGV
jgi:hypothetical protein